MQTLDGVSSYVLAGLGSKIDPNVATAAGAFAAIVRTAEHLGLPRNFKVHVQVFNKKCFCGCLPCRRTDPGRVRCNFGRYVIGPMLLLPPSTVRPLPSLPPGLTLTRHLSPPCPPLFPRSTLLGHWQGWSRHCKPARPLRCDGLHERRRK